MANVNWKDWDLNPPTEDCHVCLKLAGGIKYMTATHTVKLGLVDFAPEDYKAFCYYRSPANRRWYPEPTLYINLDEIK